jgi:polyhydroxyalkanoate synthase
MESSNPPEDQSLSIASTVSAPQHKFGVQQIAMQHEPRPLHLFLNMLMELRGDDHAFVRKVLAGVRRYQSAPRGERPPQMPELARIGSARLLDYGGDGSPVLFVPSLINPPYVLDMAEDNSLLRWLAAHGRRVLLLDWGDRRADDPTLSIAGHVEQILLPLIKGIGEKTALAGYCLGGTMAMAAAAATDVAGLALIAAPWNFRGYPAETRTGFRDLWNAGRPLSEQLGIFPMEMLQSAFWRLDPERTLSKFAAFSEMAPDAPGAQAFVALEDWANEGPPLSLPAARELVEDFFGEDMPGTLRWTIGGRPIDPAALDCPILNIISTTDRIVPPESAAASGEPLLVAKGHVGMIVGRGAREGLWLPLNNWLSQLR